MLAKDSFISLIKNVLAKLKKFLSKTFFILRGWALYLISVIFILIVFTPYLFSSFRFLNINDDSARYMLSALVQSEAAILAIVVSLSLVAIQHAASSYSPRVIDVFKDLHKNPGLWILTGIYLLSIIYSLGVLMLIDSVDFAKHKVNFVNYIKFAYNLGILAFLALVPYIWNTLNLLKPSTVINMLSLEITKQNLLSATGEEKDKPDVEDPIQPIIDILRSSLMRYDYQTLREGLKAIGHQTSIIFQNNDFKENEEEKISRHIFDQISRVGKLSISRRDEDSIIEIMDYLRKNGLIAAEQKLEKATYWAVVSLEELGRASIEQNLELATWKSVHSLEEIGEVAAKIQPPNLWQVIDSIKEIGLESIRWEQYNTIYHVSSSLENIGVVVTNLKEEPDAERIILYLKLIGVSLKSKGGKTIMILESLENILKIAKQHNLVKISDLAAKSINEIS